MSLAADAARGRVRVLAVIPARGGSKGIPRKNLVPIGGIPLIGRTVSSAGSCAMVSDVLVTTDDPEIAAVARAYGATTIDRPRELAGDTASSESALLHAIKYWHDLSGKSYDLVLLPQNTSPFHDPDDMRSVIETVACGDVNSCITVTESYRYYWAKGDTGWRMPYQARAPRQRRTPWYAEAGSLYCVRCDLFCETGNLFAEPVGAVIIPSWRAFEIDEPQDVTMAQVLWEAYCRDTELAGMSNRQAARAGGEM